MILILYQTIISLLSGVVGGVLALFGQHLASKRTMETALKTSALNAYLPVRLDVYREFLSALKVWAEHQNTESYAEFYEAASVAFLGASPETADAINALQKVIINCEQFGSIPLSAEFDAKKSALVAAMHKDLIDYRVPDFKL